MQTAAPYPLQCKLLLPTLQLEEFAAEDVIYIGDEYKREVIESMSVSQVDAAHSCEGYESANLLFDSSRGLTLISACPAAGGHGDDKPHGPCFLGYLGLSGWVYGAPGLMTVAHEQHCLPCSIIVRAG